MITNIKYLQTAIELLAEGTQPADNQIRILDTIKFICEQNIERLRMSQLEDQHD